MVGLGAVGGLEVGRMETWGSADVNILEVVSRGWSSVWLARRVLRGEPQRCAGTEDKSHVRPWPMAQCPVTEPLDGWGPQGNGS